MPSTLTAYGNLISASETARYHAEIGAARAAIADRAGEPGTVDVSGLMIVAPTGVCEYEPGHADATDELLWLTPSPDVLGGFADHHMEVCRGCLPDAVVHVLRSDLRGTPHVYVGVLQQLMTLWVADPTQDRGTRLITVSVRCPDCGQRRGRPESTTDYTPRFGVRQFRTWTNPCGHTDETAALVTEHDAIARTQQLAVAA